jgi:DNA-binding XRE family transcriptional regulator
LSKSKQKYPNHLTRYRERLGFTQQQLARIVGCRRRQTIGRIESGLTLPGVITLLRLSAALRVPVEFLYQETYIHLRAEVRLQEERIPKGTQGVLPLPS